MLSDQELSEDAADGPDVNFLSVVFVAQNELRGSVGESDHVLGQVFVVGLEESSQSEIGNFKDPLVGDEQIGCFEVPVDYVA